jgi:DNA-binding MarR family transcriptional regulator
MSFAVPRMSPAEAAAWVGLIRVCDLLPSALDSQLQHDSSMTHFEFGVLSVLRTTPDSTITMTELAEATNATLSRLSHVCRRLQSRGLVERTASQQDRRVTEVRLTTAGRRELVRATPGHIALARRLVIDALDADDLADLARITATLEERLDPDARFGVIRS